MAARTAKLPRKHTNLSLDEALLTEAKALGINVSRVAEAGLQVAVSEARGARWEEKNRPALEAQNVWIAEHGLPLAKYRMF
jgi:antitoxin CcdA